MSDGEGFPGNDDHRGETWGFLEDMASIGRLHMVLGDVEGPRPEPEAATDETPPAAPEES